MKGPRHHKVECQGCGYKTTRTGDTIREATTLPCPKCNFRLVKRR